jgi:hypothetical protein
MDGKPVKIVAYKVPADPVKGPWTPEVIDESLHVVHGICPFYPAKGRPADILVASYEGVTRLSRGPAGHWASTHLGDGEQRRPVGSRGSSEAKIGALRDTQFVATVEPWHGNEVVLYTPAAEGKPTWDRKVLDEHLKWGHAVWCADLDGDGADEIIVGVRDGPTSADEFSEKRGVRIYKSRDAAGRNWDRQLVDPGNVAVEDLTVADLDGDGRPDIIAVGRQTGNVRIYWNIR